MLTWPQKAALIAIANMFGTVTHWFSPYFFLRNQEPLYQFGGAFILFCIGMCVITVLITRWYIIRLNRNLDVKESAANEERVAAGLEPKEKGWRYPL